MTSPTIILSGPERAAYGPSRADVRTRDDLRTSAVNGVRAAPQLAADTRHTDPRLIYGKPRGELPFLAQQFAQEDAATVPSPSDNDDVAPAVRFSALRAYGAAHESTIEFLSPTPRYDFRV